MRYHSTRSREVCVSSKEAILKGLCDDGGLFVADELPEIRLNISELIRKDYCSIVFDVFRVLLDDFTEEELKSCVQEAYRGKFDTAELTPVTVIGKDRLLELYHGPTCAFKDMALCMLPKLMQCALRNRSGRIMILTATSGDTGKAALEGFRDTENIGITVFYPHGGVSDIQYLQMASQKGSNVAVAAVRGNFDDCQTAVKKVFSECGAGILEKTGVALSSANSINIGRLVPQIVYYIYAYGQLVKDGSIREGELLDYYVPTGNFGDILAGYYAKLMGLPVGRLVVCSNENHVLTDFIRTGVYDRNRPFVKTNSPSMDILISSNLERLLYYASGMDCAYTAALMKDLRETGRFCVTEEVLAVIRESFDCGYATDAETLSAVTDAWKQCGRLIDTHTAAAFKVRSDMRGDADTPAVLLSTASPYKFAAAVLEAVTGPGGSRPQNGIEAMSMLSEATGTTVPKPLSDLANAEILHDSVIGLGELEAFVGKQTARI